MSPLTRKSLLIFVFILWILPLASQNIFREGYIIKNDGDVLTGLIQFKNGQDAPNKCVFKRFEISEQVVLTKDNIKEFGYLNGNRFLLKKYNGIEHFFELLVSGKLSLYKNDDGLFLEKGETGLIKLTKGEIVFYEDGRKETVEGDLKLIEHFTEGKVNPIEKQTTKEEGELISKVAEYNKISASPYFLTNREFDDSKLIAQALITGSNRNRYGILAGTDMFMSFSPEENLSAPALIDLQTFVAGVSVERVVSRVNDRLLFGGELLYINQKFSQFYLGNVSGTVRHVEFFNFKEIKPAIYLKYTISGGKFEPFLTTGISFRTNLLTDYYQLIQSEHNGIVTTVINDRRNFKPIRINLLISGGVKYKINNKIKINLNLRIEGGTEGIFENDPTVPHKYFNIGILTGIMF